MRDLFLGSLKRRQPDHEAGLALRPISNWMLLLVVVAVAVAGSGLTWWLLGIAAADPHPSASVRIDAIRTGLSAAVGTGGAFVLLLAFRRQRSTEVSTVHTITDATERRVTELYTKAADQLGSDKAPVRLAGLYALERLAQDSRPQRQTIVNVICAYLQMPYTPGTPPVPPDDSRSLRYRQDGSESAPKDQVWEYERYEKRVHEYEKRRQEHRVRTTAQRILSVHLSSSVYPHLWWYTRIYLSGRPGVGKYLHRYARVDLSGAYLAEARFNGAEFGDGDFSEANLTRADLSNANLAGANLDGADLTGADLSGADLILAHLKNASLTGTDLSGAKLAGANLDGANLTGANLSNANLGGVNLSHASLAGANLGWASWTEMTIWSPPELCDTIRAASDADTDSDGVVVFRLPYLYQVPFETADDTTA